MSDNKLFGLYDSLSKDDECLYVMPLSGIRAWLVDFWNQNPDEEMDEQEHEELLEEINLSDEAELHERLEGIGYHMDEVINAQFEDLVL